MIKDSMIEDSIKIVILAGGSGTRLYPLSTVNNPKQFIKLHRNLSLFQMTIKRYKKIAKYKEDILVLTCDKYRHIAIKQAAELGISKDQVYAEPEGRNTAPALAYMCKILENNGHVPEHTTLIITPSDQRKLDLY